MKTIHLQYLTGSALALFPIAVNLLLVLADYHQKVTFIAGGLISASAGIFWVKLMQAWTAKYCVTSGSGVRIVTGLATLFISMILCRFVIPESVPVHYYSGMSIMIYYQHALQGLCYLLVTLCFWRTSTPKMA